MTSSTSIQPSPLNRSVADNGLAMVAPPESEKGRWVSEALYWARYYEHPDFNYEWNNGILEEKPLPDYEQVLTYGWFQALLRWYLQTNPIGKMPFLEMGFRLPLAQKTTIRKPDLFIIRNDNLTPLANDDRSYHGICDLCVESISDSDAGEIERDVKVKKGEYEGVGVHEYYILDARGRYMTFYRRAATGSYDAIAPDDDGVIHSTILPGFRFRVIDLYRQPTLLEMASDPVYQPFVMVDYQNERQRAEQEHQRAEQERQRAEQAEILAQQERTRADRLAAQLRALGIEEE
ncbi:MAG: Uma2 family endonuclease [Caldilineaceae bacterium]|nr:Uma2 family endonuclease [Caldilineaceae bacterium]